MTHPHTRVLEKSAKYIQLEKSDRKTRKNKTFSLHISYNYFIEPFDFDIINTFFMHIKHFLYTPHNFLHYNLLTIDF